MRKLVYRYEEGTAVNDNLVEKYLWAIAANKM